MTVTRRRFIAVTASAFIVPGSALGAAETVRWSGVALGARASLTINGVQKARAEELIQMAVAEISRLEQIFSLYQADSTLMELNRNGRLAAPPPDLVRLLALCGTIHRATGGAFEPTIQPLWALYAENAGRPEAAAIQDRITKIGWDKVRFMPGEFVLDGPGTAVTLNGIAQGYITDRVADMLRDAGLENVLVSVGEISAIGGREAGVPWHVGLSASGDGVADETIGLENMAIATSAPLGTVFDVGGRTGHIIDPRTGMPGGKWQHISVLNKSAAIADGLSTAFSLLDRSAIDAALAQMPETRVIGRDLNGSRYEAAT